MRGAGPFSEKTESPGREPCLGFRFMSNKEKFRL